MYTTGAHQKLDGGEVKCDFLAKPALTQVK
jgi:hypothetical protein